MDNALSDILKFKVLRAEIAKSTVPSNPVVINFDVLKHMLPHRLAVHQRLVVNGFNFERVEEAFDTGVDAPMSNRPHSIA